MKNNDNGRSMVEMLGVLAIIGVLSAGALKGYSNAMFKYKVNQSIEIYNQVIQRIIELDGQNLGADFVINSAESITQYGLMPDCNPVEYDTALADSGCQLPIGFIETDLSNYGQYLAGVLLLHFNDENSCTAFTSANWESAVPVEWGHDRYGGQNPIFGIGGNGVRYSSAQDRPSISSIAENCKQECSAGECYLQLMIREY